MSVIFYVSAIYNSCLYHILCLLYFMFVIFYVSIIFNVSKLKEACLCADKDVSLLHGALLQ